MDATMQNVGNKVAKTIHRGANKGKDVLNTVADEANEMRLQSMYESTVDQAQDAFEAAQGIVKKYPVYSALGVAAVGILAGFLIYRSRR